MSLPDEDRPIRKTVHDIGSDLSMLSVDELNARIALLKEEIERLQDAAAAKQKSRSAAEGLFKI